MKRQTILVTGASAGIGEATARRLAKAGHLVYGAARRMDRLKALETDGVRALQLDVTDDASMRSAIEHITRESGAVEVLVNNAGYGTMGALEEVPLEEARRQFDVNLFGLARMTQLVLPGMRARRAGRIINVSSVGGRVSTPLGAWYHASKHAVEGLSDCLRMETQDFGIHVSVIQPGATASEWSDIANAQASQMSSGGPYGWLVRGLAKSLQTAPTAPADAIAQLIQRAAESARPRTRYVGPGLPKVMLLLRRFMSDRTFDWLTMSVMRRAAGA